MAIKMSYERAKEYILDNGIKDLLQKDKSGKGWVCPFCESGSHSKGTGVTECYHWLDEAHTKKEFTRHYTCWTGCFSNLDVFALIGKIHNLKTFNDQFQKACELSNIEIDKKSHDKAEKPKKEKPLAEPEPDYTDFFKTAHANIDKTTYHRGLSKETLDRFNIGYVENWRHPKKQWQLPTPRLIVSTSQHSYLARITRPLTDAEKEEYQAEKDKAGKVRTFNAEALKSNSPIFLVEGEIDAMSLEELGARAVGLGSVSYKRQLAEELQKYKPSRIIIIALDNDGAGTKASADYKTLLDSYKCKSYITTGLFKPYKDANEYLQQDRAGLGELIAKTVQEAEIVEENLKIEEEEARQEAKAEMLRTSNLEYIPTFLQDIEKSKQDEPYKSGFYELDTQFLNGGFYAGLYILGAISSLGKTSFMLQIADNMAKQGKPVLYFSLEMARKELMAKSISRIIYKTVEAEFLNPELNKTTFEVMNGKCYNYYSDEHKNIINRAVEEYKEKYATNLFIEEGIGDISVETIEKKVKDFITLTGWKPAVFIDYIQILEPLEEHLSDKMSTDKNVVRLKKLSRDCDIPVICISSFNRNNYTESVNQASFKESGSIEYTSDCLIGLQYLGMDTREQKVKDKNGNEATILEDEKTRACRVHRLLKAQQELANSGKAQIVQVKVLKNRNGRRGETNLNFYPKYNTFEE